MRCRGLRQLQHGADEAVTSPWNRLNEGWVLAQCLSQQEDVVGQAAFFDESVGPKRPDQLVLLKHMSAIADQQVQSVESLRCERHDFITAHQRTLGRIQAEGSKFVEPQPLLARRLFRPGGRVAETFRGGSVACFLAQRSSLDPRENSLRNL